MIGDSIDTMNNPVCVFLLFRWLFFEDWNGRSELLPWDKDWNLLFLAASSVCWLVRTNKSCAWRKREKQRNSSRNGGLGQARDTSLFVRHQGESQNKHRLKTRENVIQVCENEASSGNIHNADKSEAVSWAFGSRGSKLKVEARPLLTANTQSETTAKIPQTSLQSMSSAAFCSFPLCVRSAFRAACWCTGCYTFPHYCVIKLLIWFSSEHFVVRFARQLEVNS